MQYKHILIISLVAIVIAVSSSFFFSPKGHQPTVKNDTPKQSVPVFSGVSAPSVAPIPPVLGSGELSGRKPVPNFQMPDSSWETRTLIRNGKPVTYEFGKGNPVEVALTGTALEEYQKDPRNRGYMTPEAEFAMKKFIEDPALGLLINRCYESIAWHDASNPWVAFPHDFDMEDILYVDPVTGRKEFRDEFIQPISVQWNALANPLEDADKRVWHTCLSSEDFALVQQNMENYFASNRAYLNPQDRVVVPVDAVE